MKKYIIQDLYSEEYLCIFPSFRMVKKARLASTFMSEEDAIKQAKQTGHYFFAIITVYVW